MIARMLSFLFTKKFEMSDLIFILIVFLSIFIYLLPGIVASSRGTKNSAQVWAIDILVGWTFIWRVIAFVMALQHTEDNGTKKYLVYSCPDCGQPLVLNQKICHNCKSNIDWQ